MNSSRILPFLAVLAVAACGGGEPSDSGDVPATQAPAEPAPSAAAPTLPSGPMAMPEWYAIDRDARTVTLTITAGATNTNNYWNFNGTINGRMAITVPEGFTVNLTLVNQDPNMPHSVVISNELRNFATPPSPEPAFAGAATENPTSMIDATMPGESETISFVAERAGTYSLVCTIPGHSALGMYMFFNVVAGDAEVGVQGS
jgi:sulfocyanin